jgi:hypothetical protein
MLPASARQKSPYRFIRFGLFCLPVSLWLFQIDALPFRALLCPGKQPALADPSQF